MKDENLQKRCFLGLHRAYVISIDSNGSIQIANLSACFFFDKELSEILGVNIIDIMPQFSDILIKAYKRR